MQPAPEAIELRHLRTFVAVAEELNFSRAAERLYYSQPALSRQIRALERLVGCPLLRRSTHRVELTLAGEALLGPRRPADRGPGHRDRRDPIGRRRARRAADPACGRCSSTLNTAGGNMAGVRAAVEELHAKFRRRPAEVAVKAANAGGVPALRLRPAGPGRRAGAVPARRRPHRRVGLRLPPPGRRTGDGGRAARSWSRSTGWRPSTRFPAPLDDARCGVPLTAERAALRPTRSRSPATRPAAGWS